MQSLVYIEASEDGVDTTAVQIAARIKKIPPEIRGPLKGIAVGTRIDLEKSEIYRLLEDILVVEVPEGADKNTEVVANILSFIAGQEKSVLFLGFTHQGMELAPAVGWNLSRPIISACLDFEWSSDTALCKRAILGGKAVATLSVRLDNGAVVSVQKGSWKDNEIVAQSASAEATITPVSWKREWAATKSEVISISQNQYEEDEDITKAEILVSAGRGLGDPENLPLVRELADLLGGMVSCSRPVVDLGWLPPSRQVGISGKTVAPVIYLALGISGQSNHVAGMNASGNIIAVNKDVNAPIFNIARYGIVDDLLEFVPEIIEQLKSRKAQ